VCTLGRKSLLEVVLRVSAHRFLIALQAPGVRYPRQEALGALSLRPTEEVGGRS